MKAERAFICKDYKWNKKARSLSWVPNKVLGKRKQDRPIMDDGCAKTLATVSSGTDTTPLM